MSTKHSRCMLFAFVFLDRRVPFLVTIDPHIINVQNKLGGHRFIFYK